MITTLLAAGAALCAQANIACVGLDMQDAFWDLIGAKVIPMESIYGVDASSVTGANAQSDAQQICDRSPHLRLGRSPADIAEIRSKIANRTAELLFDAQQFDGSTGVYFICLPKP